MPSRLKSSVVLVLVHDDAAALEVETAFAGLGLSGLLLASGMKEVEAVIAGGPVDIAVLDLDMPGSAEIGSLLSATSVPVLGITRRAVRPESAVSARSVQLPRPIETEALSVAIRTLLDGRDRDGGKAG